MYKKKIVDRKKNPWNIYRMKHKQLLRRPLLDVGHFYPSHHHPLHLVHHSRLIVNSR